MSLIIYSLHQDFMRAMRISNPAMRAIADQMERDEVLRWSNSLTRARVTRWGGMISTPDDVLQVNLDPGSIQIPFKKVM
jgi:E3 ubiquitin-protein ligase NRDP1